MIIGAVLIALILVYIVGYCKGRNDAGRSWSQMMNQTVNQVNEINREFYEMRKP